MQTDSSSAPPMIDLPRRRFFQPVFGWFFSWRLWRVLFFLLFCLVTLVGLFYAIENWRGKHAINRLKAQLYARGETLDWRRIIPVTISDDRNLAMTPLLKPLLDYGRGLNNQVEWRTSADLAKAFRMLGKGKPPGPSASEQDSFIDLKAWQNY